MIISEIALGILNSEETCSAPLSRKTIKALTDKEKKLVVTSVEKKREGKGNLGVGD